MRYIWCAQSGVLKMGVMGKNLVLDTVPDRKSKVCTDYISFRLSPEMKRRVDKLKMMGKDVPEWFRNILKKELDKLEME